MSRAPRTPGFCATMRPGSSASRTEEYMVVRHGANTWKAMTTGDADDYFRARPVYEKALREIVPRQDLRFYRSVAG